MHNRAAHPPIGVVIAAARLTLELECDAELLPLLITLGGGTKFVDRYSTVREPAGLIAIISVSLLVSRSRVDATVTPGVEKK